MKNIILTIDYEVFLGSETGDLKEVLIDPTEKLLDILDAYNSKMTVFWDVLHYYMTCKYASEYPKLQEEKVLIENQIKDIIHRGHDVQMHIHPHWLDAKYVNGKWIFDYSRFSIQKLNGNPDNDDINCICGCLCQAKILMENVIKPNKSDYCVKAYRAGGYLIEPFEPLRDCLSKLGIMVDSSVCPGSVKHTKEFGFDFSGYPQKNWYRFKLTPQKEDKDGLFIELPITTFNLPVVYRLAKYINKHFSKNTLIESKAKGKGVSFEKKQQNTIRKFFSKLMDSQYQLTTDGVDEIMLNYAVRHAGDYSVMILHPKMQNHWTFDKITQLLDSNQIRFTSIPYER